MLFSSDRRNFSWETAALRWRQCTSYDSISKTPLWRILGQASNWLLLWFLGGQDWLLPACITASLMWRWAGAHKGFVIIFVSWIIFEAWLEAGDWGWGVVMSAPDCSLLRARRQRRRQEQRAPPTSAPGHQGTRAAGRCTSQQRLIVGRRWIYQHEELILGMKSMQWIKWLQIESIPSHHLLNIQLQSLLSRTCDF